MLNNRLPRYLQFSWEEGSRLFERKRKERSAEMTGKEKRTVKTENEKLLKRLKLKDEG